MEIQLLPDSVKKNGFDYKKIKKSKNIYMFEQFEMSGESTGHWEVFKAKTEACRAKLKVLYEKEGRPFIPENYPEYLQRFPSDESFGKLAWSFMDKNKALEKFEELVDDEENILQHLE